MQVRVVKYGTRKERVETSVMAVTMILSFLAGLVTLALYLALNWQWYAADTMSAAVIILGLAVGRVCYIKWIETRTLFSILCRGIPRIVLACSILYIGHISLGLATIFGGVIVACGRAYSARLTLANDPVRCPIAYKTEIWGNLVTQILLALAWCAVITGIL